MKRFIFALVCLCICVVGLALEAKESRAAITFNTFQVGATLYPITGTATKLAAVAVAAGRYIGPVGTILTGLQLLKLAAEQWGGQNNGPIDIIPSPTAQPCLYLNGACIPPSSVSQTTVFGGPYSSSKSNTASQACVAQEAAFVAANSCTGASTFVRVGTETNPSCHFSVVADGHCFGSTNTDFTWFSVSSSQACPVGYSISGNVCVLTTPSIAQWDKAQVPNPVYSPNTAGTGFQHDVRDPNPPSPFPPPSLGSIWRDGFTQTPTPNPGCPDGTNGIVMPSGLTCVSQSAREIIAPNPNGGFVYQTWVQTPDKTASIVDTFTVASDGTITAQTHATVPSVPPTAAPTTGAQPTQTMPTATDPTTGNPTVPVSGTGTGATSVTVNFPTDYARDSSVTQLHKDLTTPTTAPAVPDAVVKTDFTNVFFKDTFTSLIAWQVPGHSSQCPKPELSDGRGHTIKVESHCDLWAANSNILSLVMIAAWSITALFIVLRA